MSVQTGTTTQAAVVLQASLYWISQENDWLYSDNYFPLGVGACYLCEKSL